MSLPRLAVIGSGHLGKIHARLAKASGLWNLVAVADSVSAARESLADELQVLAVADAQSLIGRIDAAIIATPTSHHAATANILLRQGVDALVEKPLAANVPDAVAIVEAARLGNAILQVGHIERFSPAWSALGTEWDEATYFESNRTSPHAFRSIDIGVVHDLMIHDLDLVLSKCAAPLVRVDATTLTVIGPHEDQAHARLEFADGRVALLRASRISSHVERSMQIFCDQRHAIVDFASPSVTFVGRCAEIVNGRFRAEHLSPEQRELCKRELFETVLPSQNLALEKRNAIADEQSDFAQSIQLRRSPVVSGMQGLRAVRVAEQILDAATKSTLHGIRNSNSDLRRAG